MQRASGAAASRIVVVKIGGSTLGSQDSSLKDVVTLQKRGVPTIVVHGGGPVITQWMEKQGVYPTFVRGLRVTDAPSMEVVAAVLGGLVNKSLAASLFTLGGQAMGISGADGGILQATILEEALGLVGKVERVNPQPLMDLLERGYIPLVAPIAVYGGQEPEKQGWLLNINGDTAAGEIAAAVRAERLVFLTDVDGVLDTSRRLIRRVTPQQIAHLLEGGVIQGGMVPKAEASLTALKAGTVTSIVDGRRPDALLEALEDRGPGTLVG